MTRTLGVDLLSRSLLTSLPPVQAARGIVLHGLNVLAAAPARGHADRTHAADRVAPPDAARRRLNLRLTSPPPICHHLASLSLIAL